MPIKNSHFYSGLLNLYFPVTVITGASRSGKTLLGNLLATCPSVEYADEPWTAMLLPAISNTGKVDRDFASRMLQTYCCELFNDLVLLRKANFRVTDLSSIWTKKEPQEIFFRLSQIHSRADVVSHAKDQQLSLVMTLTESLPFVDFICQSIPSVKIIHVIRNGFEVAAEIRKKGWFTNEQLLSPQGANLYNANQLNGLTWYIPWWVDDNDKSYFLSLSEYERGIYYWSSLVEKGLLALNSHPCESLTINYRDLVNSTVVEFERAKTFLNLSPGRLTPGSIESVSNAVDYNFDLPLADGKLTEKVLSLHRNLGID